MARRIAIGALVLFVVGAAAAVALYASSGKATGHPAFFERAVAAFEAQDRESPPPKGAIVFVGSSSIRMWRTLERDMAPIAVLNRGFGGSQLEHVVYNVRRIVTPYAPRAVVVYAGDNDLASGTGKTAADVVRDYRALVELVQTDLPSVPIYYLAIKPSKLRWERWPEMAEANRRIAEWSAGEPLLHYLDVASPLLGEDGRPRDDVFLLDGLHMNASGYAAWTDVVRPVLLEAFGPR